MVHLGVDCNYLVNNWLKILSQFEEKIMNLSEHKLKDLESGKLEKN